LPKGKAARLKPVEATVRAHPQCAAAVLIDIAHGVAAEAVGVGRVGAVDGERAGGAIQAVEPSV